MDRLVFCRKAKELVRNIIRGWYRLEITTDGLLRAADRNSFTWIGVNSREYLPGLSGETLRERLRRMQTSPVPLLMDREKYSFQPVTDRFCCILAEGLSYRAIAEALQITPRTVRYYVAELCRRLGAENRAQLIAATRKWRKRLGGWKTKNKQT